MNFTCLLLSCCLASLPERITFFYFTLIFQEENLPRGNVECLGFLTLDIRSCACEYQNTPATPGSSGQRAALPSRPPLCSDMRQEKQTAFNNWQVNGSYSSSHKTACTWRCFQLQKEHVRTEKAETREPFGMSVWGLRLTTSPDMYRGKHLSAMGSKMHSTSTCSYSFASRTRKG